MQPFFLHLQAWWKESSQRQKFITLAGLGLLLLLLYGTFYYASRPNMKMLFGGLSPADQGMVIEELQKLNIPVQYNENGDVFVPSGKAAEARAKLALSEKLPSSGHSGYSELEKLGMMNTPKVEKERLKVLLEGELAKSIENIQGVRVANVHLSLGDDSPFISERVPASASIGIVETAQGSVGKGQAKAIALLVSNGVPGLTPQNVAILSNYGQILWDGQNESGAAGLADRRLQAEVSEARRREQELQRVLDTAFGVGNTIAMVNVTMDFDKKVEETHDKTPNSNPLIRETNEETMKGQNGALGGLAGTASNVPNAAPAAPSNNSQQDYTGKQTSENFGSNEKKTVLETTPGMLTGMSINVLANQNVIKNPLQVQSFLQGYLGPYQANPHFTATVTSIPFDQQAQVSLNQAATVEASKQRMKQLLSFLPILAILAVGYMLSKSLKKVASEKADLLAATASQRTFSLSQGSYQAALPGSQNFQQEGNLSPSNGVNALLPGSTELINPDIGNFNGFSPGNSPEAAQKSPQRAYEKVQWVSGENGEPIRIDAIQDKINVPLEQIKKMADEKPDLIAMLIKTLLAEGGI